MAQKPWQIWIIYVFYGLYFATTEGVAQALVAKLVPNQQQGTAFGFFYASLGIMTLPANLLVGYLWEKDTSAAVFYFGAGCAIVALLVSGWLKNLADKN